MPAAAPAYSAGTLFSTMFNSDGSTRPLPSPQIPIREIVSHAFTPGFKRIIWSRKAIANKMIPNCNTRLPNLMISFDAASEDAITTIPE